MTKVSPIRRRDDGRYTWTADLTVYGLNDQGREDKVTKRVELCTNANGDGLWINGRQELGTGQFSLSGVSPSTRRRRVLGWYERHENEMHP